MSRELLYTIEFDRWSETKSMSHLICGRCSGWQLNELLDKSIRSKLHRNFNYSSETFTSRSVEDCRRCTRAHCRYRSWDLFVGGIPVYLWTFLIFFGFRKLIAGGVSGRIDKRTIRKSPQQPSSIKVQSGPNWAILKGNSLIRMRKAKTSVGIWRYFLMRNSMAQATCRYLSYYGRYSVI